MGCDVFYHCRTAERDQVERLVAVIDRYAREHDLPCRIIDIRNCALRETDRWDWPAELAREVKTVQLARNLGSIGRGQGSGKPLTESDIDCLTAARNEKIKYFEGCQRSSDLYGIAFPPPFELDDDEEPELFSRGQLIFDFRANGLLVNCAIDPQFDRAANTTVPCSFLKIDGYWRSVSDYLAFPRFLTLCRIRYLPALDFGSDYDEKERIVRELAERPGSLDELRQIGDEEFYDRWLRGRTLIG